MSNISQLVWNKCGNREGKNHWERYAPFYICLTATVLVMMDPLRHVLQDGEIWVNSHMYRDGCDSDTIKCLSVLGVFFTIIFTYLGYALLLVGVVWGTDSHKKIRAAWRTIRARQLARAASLNP